MCASSLTFAKATAVEQVPGESHRYSAYFHDEYCIGSVLHGGYVAAIFIEVARRHFLTTLKHLDQPDTMTMQLSFLRRTAVGPAFFSVKDMKTGKQTSTLQISLAQGQDERTSSSVDRKEVIAYLTQTNFSKEKGMTLQTGWALHPPVAAAVDLSKLSSDKDTNWALLKNPPFPKFRKASLRTRWFLPKVRPRNFTGSDTWMGLSTKIPTTDPSKSGAGWEYEKWTTPSLAYISDLFPQVIEDSLDPETYNVASEASTRRGKGSVGSAFWLPTVVLNLEIKKRVPDEGLEFLFQRVRTKQVANGRYDLEVIVMDKPEGDILALSHHTVLLMTAERNMSGRGKNQESKSKQSNL